MAFSMRGVVLRAINVFFDFLLKKYLELSPSRIGWKLVILRVVLVAGGGGGSDA